MIDEIFGALRGIAGMGTVQSVNDVGEAQTVTVEMQDGAVRADVEVLQVFGLASVPPANGAICLLIAVGGDPANLRAWPIASPSARFGGLQPGEMCIYAVDGSRVHIKQGGIVEVWAGASMVINAPAVTVNGTMTVTGDVVAGPNSVSLTKHTHPDPQGGNTGTPSD